MDCITTLVGLILHILDFTKDWAIAVITGIGLASTLKRELFTHVKDWFWIVIFLIVSYILGCLVYLLIEAIICKLL